jgi:hypothetical protein
MLVRGAFSDFGAAQKLFARQDLIRDHGYTENDISLLANWFYIDPDILNLVRLEGLLRGLEANNWALSNLALVWPELTALIGPGLRYVSLGAALLTVFTHSPVRMLLAWLYILILIFSVGILGRVGTTHAYYPLICFIICLGTMFLGKSKWHMALWATMIALAVSASIETTLQNRYSWTLVKLVREDMQYVNWENTHVIWGAAFPFEAAYPVFKPVKEMDRFRWYSFAGFTGAPFMSEDWGDGYKTMVERIASGVPVSIFASDGLVELLSRWCREHQTLNMEILEAQRLRTFSRYTIVCR